VSLISTTQTTKLLALVVGGSVQISGCTKYGVWDHQQFDNPPRMASNSAEDEILPVGLHFLDRDRKLVASYLYHGIV
jgi:hypothetical protein